MLQPENAEGHVVLSLRRAAAEAGWRRAEELLHSGEIVDAPVVECNRGGLIVDVGVRGCRIHGAHFRTVRLIAATVRARLSCGGPNAI